MTVVGARPQFVKAATLSRALTRSAPDVREILVHTGQHFDHDMSQVFFDQLEISRPDYNLQISGLDHSAMTGRMLERLGKVIHDELPDLVLVYGDTNSTIAAALAAVKMHVPVAHVEAGLRSFNMRMPEEVNRVLTDRISTLLFCPGKTAVNNLCREGITDGVFDVGDIMFDTTLYYRERAREAYKLEAWGLTEKQYVLCTIHRAENTDDPNRFGEIWEALRRIAEDVSVVFPVHPRTRPIVAQKVTTSGAQGIRLINPLSYVEMTRLAMSAQAILTDSGGLQKEAFFHRVPCLTARDETEWVETVDLGWNAICGADTDRLLRAWGGLRRGKDHQEWPYGDGTAATRIVNHLVNSL